jgi:solute carrier family 35 protein F5
MTSPLAVTLGLSLTIPLAVMGDLARGTHIGGWALFFGATLVLSGFVAVGYADYKEQHGAEADGDTSTVISQNEIDTDVR